MVKSGWVSSPTYRLTWWLAQGWVVLSPTTQLAVVSFEQPPASGGWWVEEWTPQLFPGKWVTIYANQGHTFAIIAGLRFDTVALAQYGSRWSNTPPIENMSSFAVRHPPGL